MNILVIILAFMILACSKIKKASCEAWKQAQDKACELVTEKQQSEKQCSKDTARSCGKKNRK